MFYIFLILLSCIPIGVGITLLVLFEKNRLSKIIFLLLIMVTLWQLDIAFLYAHRSLEKETILFLFNLFRFGSIMITPTFFYLGYTIVQEMLPKDLAKKWQLFINRSTVLLFYGIAFFVYIISWSDKAIQRIELMNIGSSIFYFPVYGELSWIYIFNIMLSIVNMTICLFISLHVPNKSIQSFLVYFMIFSAFGFAIGSLNMFPSARLYPSSIALLVYALSILILTSRMHLDIVNNMNRKLSEQKKFLFQVIDLNPNYIYAKDEFDRYTLVNQSYAQLMGKDTQEMIGKTYDELQKDNDTEPHSMQKSDEFKQTDQLLVKEESIKAASGEERWVQTVKIPIHIHDSSALLAVSTDITERKQFEDEIQFQANHDTLTGLPNRRKFNKDLSSLLEKAKSEDSQNAIVFLDLDRFKYINDTLGHDAGDLLLKEVSSRIKNLLKRKYPSAEIYRIGGDEFTILLPHATATDSEGFAKDVLNEFKESFVLEGSNYFISLSIGISLFPNDGYDVNTLIKHADIAMYYVKGRGKNDFQLFTPQMQQEFERKVMIEKQLQTALVNEEIELFYQPIMDLKTNEIVGMESLIRWNNKVLGQVPPDEFISIAEETGVIIPIGHWVLNTAIEQHARWQKTTNQPIYVSINVSVRQLLDPTFLEKLKNAIENNLLDPSQIVLEITESIAMYAESMSEKLAELKKLGISLSMDDFGTGYSSLSYLTKYPLDSLKIDKSFVINMHRNDENKAIIQTITAIAKEFDLKVIAEGVEGQEAHHFLKEIGCDYAQGYHFSPPVPASEFQERWL
ncbi:EAL domain-containing protein [Sporosarcina pasteurii]|uniref:Cyclic di-GMP phosphodiesterase Gmr n=1 Tax=Sporosarcina pasteurii TaxID=1474 RepID=A0A380BF05_SPOPA|nr:EAL domain-containing protein [Sporosarcina pasteurii]MDS9472608.1 EAL domain-containing protein [Sporosarcina pasteurii]QBQ06156.1 EAL domain-containing protein [Sporosarcina pasteurii]SUI99310.1 Cyclic di-GMP phosphodiesterase Gmr [Sporosarcina pasteurii]